MSDLMTKMQALAKASGQSVVVGCYSHRDDWFASCGVVEWQGPTPEQALESVHNTLMQEADQDVSRLSSATERARRLRELGC
jgi:hypothetical protein